MSHLKALQTEYEQARDKWIDVNQLRTNWESEDPVYNEVLRDYKEKQHAYYHYLRESDANLKRIRKPNVFTSVNHSARG